MTTPRQCKDIPDQPILDFLATLKGKRATWGTWADGQPVNGELPGLPSVARAMPPGTPEKLQRAKMARLIERGLVDGCGCGCRGDYTLKGAS